MDLTQVFAFMSTKENATETNTGLYSLLCNVAHESEQLVRNMCGYNKHEGEKKTLLFHLCAFKSLACQIKKRGKQNGTKDVIQLKAVL